MDEKFLLEILTPERLFLRGPVTFVTLLGLDGYFTIYKGHMPMVLALQIGTMTINDGILKRDAVNSEGYIEIRPDRVLMFVQTCEWLEDIDENRALRAKQRAEEELRQKQSIYGYKSNKIALARAMARLSSKKKQ